MPYKDKNKQRANAKRFYDSHIVEERQRNKIKSSQYRAARPDVSRMAAWRKIGIDTDHWSYAQYLTMLEAQNGRCLGCGRGLVATSAQIVGDFQVACVDHSHVTGRVRGLLCDNCNKAIGQCSDSPEILRKLADYLEGILR